MSIGILTGCILFGIGSFLLYRNYDFFAVRKSSKSEMHSISGYECKLTRTIPRAYNALYVEYESEVSGQFYARGDATHFLLLIKMIFVGWLYSRYG